MSFYSDIGNTNNTFNFSRLLLAGNRGGFFPRTQIKMLTTYYILSSFSAIKKFFILPQWNTEQFLCVSPILSCLLNEFTTINASFFMLDILLGPIRPSLALYGTIWPDCWPCVLTWLSLDLSLALWVLWCHYKKWFVAKMHYIKQQALVFSSLRTILVRSN